MKNILNLLLFIGLILTVSTPAFATCSTGFACSIQGLENLQETQYRDFKLSMNSYFDKKINEDIFFGKIPSSVNYNDLFLFNTII